MRVQHNLVQARRYQQGRACSFVCSLLICTQLNTHAKISHLVASLPTSRQQVVFPLLVTSNCQQVWNKLLTICNNLVDIIRLVTRLFQQVRYSHDIEVLLQPCVLCRQPCNILVLVVYHDCIRLVRTSASVFKAAIFYAK
jgi:hypothetical protein